MADTVEKLTMQVEATNVGVLDVLATKIDVVAAATTKANAAGTAAVANNQTADVYELADAYDVLGEELQSVYTSASNFGRGWKSVEVAAASQTTAATKATTALERQSRAAKDAGAATGNLGRGFLELSRGIEDAQYGLGGVLNNIPNAISMFGGPAGLAAVVSLTAVGAYQLRHEFTALNEHLNDRPWINLGDSISTVKKRLEELADKPHKLDIDYSRLDDARKILDVMEKKLAGFKAISDATDTQEKVGKAVTHVIREEAGGTDEQSGKANLEKLITASGGIDLQDEAIRTSKNKKAEQIREAQARLESLKAMKPDDLVEAAAIGEQIKSTEESLAKLRHDLKDIVKEKVDEIIGGAVIGIEKERAKIAALFDQNQRLFTQGDAAQGILPVTPTFRAALGEAKGTEITRIEEEDAQEKRQEDQQKTGEVIRAARKQNAKNEAEAKKKDDNKAIDQLNADGLANEAAMKAQDRLEGKDDRSVQVRLNQEAKHTEDAIDAEVKKIADVLGKTFKEEYERQIAVNTASRAAGGPAFAQGELESRLQRDMIRIFRQRGATEQGANLAARQITGRGQADLARQQATRQVRAGFRPIAPNRRSIQPKAKPVVAARPVAKPRPLVGPPKPIARAPRPIPPEIAEEIARQNAAGKGQPGDQAALKPLATTQQAMGATQQAMSGLVTRVAQLESNAARLMRQAGQLGRATNERQHSALNGGGSTV